MNNPQLPYISCPGCSTVFAAPATLPGHGKVRCGVCETVILALDHGLSELPEVAQATDSAEQLPEQPAQQEAQQVESSSDEPLVVVDAEVADSAEEAGGEESALESLDGDLDLDSFSDSSLADLVTDD